MMKEMILAIGALILLSAAPRVGMAQISAQQGSSTQSGTTSTSKSGRPGLPSIDGQPADSSNEDPSSAMREAGRARSFASERQRKMTQDTDKLLALATELKQQMDKSNKNEMSLDVIKKADEIERLAHDVKIRMKG